MASLRPAIQLNPNLSSLVSLAYETNLELDWNLPEELFRPESVATTRGIGQGSTFATSCKRIPKPVDYVSRHQQGDGAELRVLIQRKVPKNIDYIVYKVAQVEFTQRGQAVPDHRHRLAAVMVELLVLTHKPIRDHPFLPDLFGFAWAQNQYSSQQHIPIPIVDWANKGSLDVYQSHNVPISDNTKRYLAWQVAVALQFLHDCNIYHGDVKSENVLLFERPGGSLDAKLSDFGMSVVSEHGYLNYVPPGTLKWAAPEIRWASPTDPDLKKADTFSYGLLVWRLLLEGVDPLHKGALGVNGNDEAIADPISSPNTHNFRPDDTKLRHMIESNQILDYAASLKWLDWSNILKRWPGKSPSNPVNDQMFDRVSKIFNDKVEIDLSGLAGDLQRFNWAVELFRSSLSTDPNERNLLSCLAALEKDQKFEKPKVIARSLEEINPRRLNSATRNSVLTSWHAMRYVDPRTRTYVMTQRLYRSNVDTDASAPSASDDFGNAICLISAMGSDQFENPQRALMLLQRAAKKGCREAAALLYRVTSTFGADVPHDIAYIQPTFEAAYLGSASALEDLQIIGGELVPNVRYILQVRTCGVGANFFFNEVCINGCLFEDLDDLGWIKTVLDNASTHPQLIRVNQRGDNFLHAAVSLKIDFLFHLVLEELKFDVNFQNHEGETPLLCAMRAGSVLYVQKLMACGADPSIPSRRGETPLHWVSSSSDVSYRNLIEQIYRYGGGQTINNWAQRCDYAASMLMTYCHYAENLCEGTPIHWAVCRKDAYLVRLLVERGAPINVSGANGQLSALEVAAHLHEAEILRYLIQKQTEQDSKARIDDQKHHGKDVNTEEVSKPTIWGGARIVRAAIEGCDRFSLICRHGQAYKTFSQRTFRLLGREFENTEFVQGVDNAGRSALQYAAQGGYGEAVELILKYFRKNVELDQVVEDTYWTPICDAIHRNHLSMFELLCKKGADVNVRVDSPARKGTRTWGTLHVAARSSVPGQLGIARRLLDLGVPLDGYTAEDTPEDLAESPLSLAIENDAFDLADLLRSCGADINATSRHLLGGSAMLDFPVNILGRLIASNMRYSKRKLQYLLFPPPSARDFPQADFVVIPDCNITALHWSVAMIQILPKLDQDGDYSTILEILTMLLERFDSDEELNAQTSNDTLFPEGWTALHKAADMCYFVVVDFLVREPGNADVNIRDKAGRTPIDLAIARQDLIARKLEQGKITEPLARQVLDAADKTIECLKTAAADREGRDSE